MKTQPVNHPNPNPIRIEASRINDTQVDFGSN
jgi:hypothetical protein